MATCTLAVATADTGADPNTSGAFTPASGDLLVVFVVAATTVQATGSLTSSVSGFTFTQITRAAMNADTSSFYAFVSDALVSDTSSQTVTFETSSDPLQGTVIFVYRVSGTTKTGLTAIRQNAKLDNQTAGTPAVTFSAACQTANPTLAALMVNANPAGSTAPSGWTEDADTGFNTPAMGGAVASRNSGFTGTTITWGADPGPNFCAIGLEIDTSGDGTTASPGVGALTLTGYAPTVETPVTVTPAVGALALTGLAPTVQTPTNVTPAVGELTLAGLAPTVGLPVSVTPGVGELALAGFAPTVNTGAATDVDPGVGALALAGFAPSVALPVTASPDVGALALTGYAPTVETPVTVTAGLGTLALAGLAPTVELPTNVAPGTGALLATGYAPTVELPVSVSPALGALLFTGFAPSVETPVTVTLGLGELSLTGYAPEATTSTPVNVAPGLGALVFTGFAPDVRFHGWQIRMTTAEGLPLHLLAAEGAAARFTPGNAGATRLTVGDLD